MKTDYMKVGRMMESILILGGSNSQINLIKKAKARGLHVIVADYYDKPPGALYADKHEKVSTFDVDACLRVAKDNAICAVATTGTDQPVYTAACISAELGLPSFVSVETALAATNKIIMKRCFEEHRIPNARHIITNSSLELCNQLYKLTFPIVIKPVDSQGQRGVFMLNSPDEVEAYLKESISYSREGYVLIEEYCGQNEFTSIGFLIKGEYRHIITTKRNTFIRGHNIGVCSSHLCPAPEHFEYYDEIASLSERAAKAVGITDGPVYIQLLRTSAGFIVNELAARVGGGHEDVMIPYITGFDILDAVLDGALGIPPTINISKPDGNRYASNQLLFARPGVISGITPIETLQSLPCVISAGYNYKIGDTLGCINDATARLGHCVVIGNNVNDLEDNVDKIYDVIEILDENGRNMVIKGSVGKVYENI